MKKFLFLLCLGVIYCFQPGCIKRTNTCTPVSVQTEESTILNYAAANGVTPVKHSTGLYYQIITPGYGASPWPGSVISVRYTGKFINNMVFDQQQDASKTGWPLNTLIEGWQIGIPLIQKGGQIKLLIPSSLGYGCRVVGSVPANSILIFDVELVDIQ